MTALRTGGRTGGAREDGPGLPGAIPLQGLVHDVEAWVLELNDLREAARGTCAGAAVEELLERVFRAGRRLAVYGSLQPGAEHADVLADLGGTWSSAFVRGDLEERGWGAALGYPALRLRPHGERVAVRVLEAPELPRAWPRIDAFEGEGYRRSLAPLYDEEDQLLGVANLYEARAAPSKDDEA